LQNLDVQEVDVDPRTIGALPCRRCGCEDGLKIELRSIASRTTFASLQCPECLREAISEVYGTPRPGIVEAVYRWNSIWPDVAGFVTGDSEGFRWTRY
jgi:hypothetical protein